MLKVIIVDDEVSAQQNLSNLFNLYCPLVEVLGCFSSAKEAIQFLNHNQVDCLFTDIKMPQMDGFELVEAIEKQSIQVVFTTAYSDYAIQAFKANAVDYLLKPIAIEDLENTVEKLAEKHKLLEQENGILSEQYKKFIQDSYQTQSSTKITVPHNQGFKVIDSKDIIRVWAEGSYSNVVLNQGKSLVVTKNIGHFEKVLSKHHCVRIHHSHLINLDYLLEYSSINGGTAIMQDGCEILISRRKLKAFKQQISEYYL